MKLPAALVLAVFVWCSSKYLPTYFVEMRKIDLLEQRMQLDAAKQIAMLKDVRTQMQSQTRATAEAKEQVDSRFY